MHPEPNPPIRRLKWTWLPDVRTIQNLTVGIVDSDEPPSPEYIVVIEGTMDGVAEVARCDRFSPGALAKMQQTAEFVADLLEILECSWVPGDPFALSKPG